VGRGWNRGGRGGTGPRGGRFRYYGSTEAPYPNKQKKNAAPPQFSCWFGSLRQGLAGPTSRSQEIGAIEPGWIYGLASWEKRNLGRQFPQPSVGTAPNKDHRFGVQGTHKSQAHFHSPKKASQLTGKPCTGRVEARRALIPRSFVRGWTLTLQKKKHRAAGSISGAESGIGVLIVSLFRPRNSPPVFPNNKNKILHSDEKNRRKKKIAPLLGGTLEPPK